MGDFLKNTSLTARNVSNASSSDTKWDEEGFYTVLAWFACLILGLGIPGNALVIASVSLNKHLRTAPNLLVLSLSVCDFLFLSTALPAHIYTYFNGKAPARPLCWIAGYLTNWFVGSSVLSTGAIAINRYVVIVLGNRFTGNALKTVVIMCIFVYTFPFILLIPAFFGTVGTFGFETTDRQCGWVGGFTLKTIVVICIAVFPLVFMSVCYIRILLHVVATRKRVTALGRATAFGPNRKETKLSLMLSMVYLVYLVTTFPAFLLNILINIGVFVPMYIQTSSFTVVWSSSAINPVVYGLVNKKYRDAYIGVLKKLAYPFRKTEIESVDSSIR